MYNNNNHDKLILSHTFLKKTATFASQIYPTSLITLKIVEFTQNVNSFISQTIGKYIILYTF